jgi:hypothetical protein
MRKSIVLSAAVGMLLATCSTSFAKGPHSGGGGGKPQNLLSVQALAGGEYLGYIDFQVSRTTATKKSVTVSVTTGAGSAPAAAGGDVDGGFSTFSVTIAAGETTAPGQLVLVDDSEVEGAENLTFTLGAAPRGYVLDTTATTDTGAIVDNDHAAFVLPIGYTLHLRSMSLSGCDPLTLGLMSSASPGLSPLGSNSTCGPDPVPDADIPNLTEDAVTFTIALYDAACDDPDTGATQVFMSDGTATSPSVNHASVNDNGDGSFTVYLNDALGGLTCGSASSPTSPSTGNARATLSMSPS